MVNVNWILLLILVCAVALTFRFLPQRSSGYSPIPWLSRRATASAIIWGGAALLYIAVLPAISYLWCLFNGLPYSYHLGW